MNGFLHDVKHQIPECTHEMRHAYLEAVKLSAEEKQHIMDKAAELWDEYWTVSAMEGQTIAQGWERWSRDRSV